MKNLFGFDPSKFQEVDETSLTFAKKLYDAVKAKGLWRKAPRLIAWARYFARLQHQDNISKERISQVLEWYIQNIGKEFIPKIYSAQTFRNRFTDLERSMIRQPPSAEYANKIELTHEARRLQERLSLRWPKEEYKQELLFIQLSLNNYRDYRQRLETIADRLRREAEVSTKARYGANPRRLKHSKDWREFNLIQHIISWNPNANYFIECWLREVHDLAWNWSKWNNNLLLHVFTIEHKHFQRLLTERILEYSGFDYTRKIMELLHREG